MAKDALPSSASKDHIATTFAGYDQNDNAVYVFSIAGPWTIFADSEVEAVEFRILSWDIMMTNKFDTWTLKERNIDTRQGVNRFYF